MFDTEKQKSESTSPSTRTAHVEPLPFHVQVGLGKLLRTSLKKHEVVGTNSLTALASLFSLPETTQSTDLPHVLVLPHQEDCEKLVRALHFFDPHLNAQILPAFDVGIYSNLYPNRRLIAERILWLFRAQNAQRGEIFVASIQALLQRTLPFETLAHNTFHLRQHEPLPKDFTSLLERLGYSSVPLVEDVGTYALRGGILDVFSSAHPQPIRLELFGDLVDSIRFFDPESQRSTGETKELVLVPAFEVLYSDEIRQQVALEFKKSVADRDLDSDEVQQVMQDIAQGQYFHGAEFLLPYFYKDRPTFPLEHFSSPINFWLVDPPEVARQYDDFYAELKKEYELSETSVIRPRYQDFFLSFENLVLPPDSKELHLSKILFADIPAHENEEGDTHLEFKVSGLKDFSQQAHALSSNANELASFLGKRISDWKNQGIKVFIASGTTAQCQRIQVLLEKGNLHGEIVEPDRYLWASWGEEQNRYHDRVHLIPRKLEEGLRFQDEGFVFLRDEDLFGSKKARREYKQSGTLENRAHALSFGDLKPGDFVVHKVHGIGIYEGLKVMAIQGIDAEFIQLKYKDKDRLYLPVYRIGQIQKYSGPTSPHLIDKLGGQAWEKTKTKVRAHLRDLAAELLQIYAQRSQMHRPPFSTPDDDFINFENSFAYEETEDQLKAINDVVHDLCGDKPMDRLVCGDVGYGKTEVAMRAAFKAVQDGRQVAIIAPTTVLTFQHLENFKKRFARWPLTIRSLNRFVPKKQITETLRDLREGKVDIVIGTHRLLSKDVGFKDLGLLIVDEEQKFGVKHKERLRKFKVGVDTLAMSATPIPRTLNMSLMGIRDLSIINTAPVDRLPTRTFVCKFDGETIRKAVMSEIQRGGQVFFIHNRIQSIYALADELRQILPEVRMKIAHGQMEEGELEKTMLAFFNHEIDLLLCTTIIESGMDIPRANTMFIDNAHQLGLSQLYQLRGRVGRSKERAYCYLIIPANRRIDNEAQERLKVIQENTALGSGIRIAHYDLELRGAGDLLGEEQSGHINAVGYELYLELLEDAVRTAKGEPSKESEIEPEINVRIPALIPDQYIPDIRIRLAYYKALSEIQSPEDIDRIEDELRDQFGRLPEPVLNLMGLMLIRKYCKDLGIRDLSSGKSSIALMFTEQTPLAPQKVIELTLRPNKKYSLNPDSRLSIRMNEISWPKIYDELVYLKSLC